MPENDHQHPRRTLPEDGVFTRNARAPFVELGLASCFSFLRGASDAVDLVRQAWQLGYDALGIADLNTLAGVVRLHVEAHKAQVRPLTGCRIGLLTGEEFLAYPTDREAYGRLSRLLSKGKMQDAGGAWQQKGICDLALDDLAREAHGLILIAVPGDDITAFGEALPRLVRHLPEMGHIAASYLYRGDDRARITALDRLAKRHGLSILATNDVLYHVPERRPLQDVMTCIREKCTLTEAGFRLEQNAERHLKGPAEMMRLFSEWPHAIRASREIADRITFDLSELAYEYPREVIPEDMSPQDWLEELTWRGAAERYPDGVPDETRAVLRKELAMIAKLDIARYFLTIHDIIKFAREDLEKPILCQGRGSAANSAVCYVLGITAVDPAQHQLLFERFISEERKEPPDIDVDFEHERREEVIQHIYDKYGRDRAGLCATVIHYRPRSAIREVGKVMGLSEDVTGALAKTIWGSWGKDVAEGHVAEAGLDLSDPVLRRTIILARQLIGMPRHLSQHVGGFILTERPLTETVPIGNGAMPDRSFIEWDKDDIDALGILKVDILALGMLTCIRKAFDMISAHYGEEFTLATTPREDPRVYEMLCRGDSVGVFQVESRAQMNMLPRLRPREFYDLVIEVAIVRPGPIQGDMVHPYLRRRNGEEAVDYPAPGAPHDPAELKNILGRTLGVPIFQEQAMKIAIEAAEFSPAEANELRKAMATFRSKGTIGLLEEKMVGRMVARGYDEDFARRCFNQIKGFGEYGFPESHAASFAHLVYVSSWLKCHYPAVFCAALLNSQPMGFYAPAQIVRDAREHGVTVRPPDVNFSDWDNTLEPVGAGAFAVRLGFRQVTGLREDVAARIMAAREAPYRDLADLKARAGISAAHIRRLAEADAMRSMFIDRRQALWEAKGLRDAPDLPLFRETRDEGAERPVALPAMPVCEQVVADYQTLRLSLKAHPMAFLRKSLTKSGYATARSLHDSRDRQKVRLAGLVLIRQRPGSANGVCFITLEDETGVANLVVWPKVMEQYRKVVMQSRLLAVHGYIQRDVEIIHLVATHLEDRSDALLRLSPDGLKPAIAHADEVNRPVQGRLAAPTSRHPRDAAIIPKSRDFH
ncbi:error-prone DNA polymerase [Ponticoccus sp. SC2-23]|uniref:error-prone DNA polymerase n=1 Tax=Alexandriicola marinus TaxID=2081710 RepID=UPI000FDBC654|nr:error-prone DNA polymerase [Alexandriicola marinus]MBM1220830.1 error-prone DNA polymerase [Ponticoccus sp. SC6-9]MBM1225400.1 error-prone DNA polymerase [Ponticoccus sp. SC6-15]MBM1227583.1 error-prone DNA polymerase [Ponticoccus sp. SC6-38]MBM1234779.1 error-prone DNA polymerase [Ponticoccus sp. SC6-45]MBM1238085.1 error-prone DNA polymerase [Ponticoccus sp. SC6-49]MBM1244282.1 error-prone DNA polymerase [Ponticoccus sp. SC2-64]MBM1248303.1 error-prone DNA polymerase [Ponticoccus sp. SC